MVDRDPPTDEAAQVGVDVGGTFTDAVVVHRGRVWLAKRPTTVDDQSRGVIDAVRAVLEEAGVAPADVRAFGHGMTVGTNALLQGKGAAPALVAAAGLRRRPRAAPPDPGASLPARRSAPAAAR